MKSGTVSHSRISLEVGANEIFGLIGARRAAMSTLIGTLTGAL